MNIEFRITRLQGLWQIQDTPRTHPPKYFSLAAAVRYLRDCRTPPHQPAVIAITDANGRTRRWRIRHRVAHENWRQPSPVAARN